MIVERIFERTRHRVAPVWHPRKGFEVFPRRNNELSPKISPRGSSSVGRARPCQGRGRGFKSRLPLQMQRTRLRRMSLNLLVGGEIRYTTRGEGNRTVGREWLHKYGNVRADGSSSHCGCEGPRFEPETSPKDKQATSFVERC